MLSANQIERLLRRGRFNQLLDALARNGLPLDPMHRIRLSSSVAAVLALGLRRLTELAFAPSAAELDLLDTLLERQDLRTGAFDDDALATAAALAAIGRVADRFAWTGPEISPPSEVGLQDDRDDRDEQGDASRSFASPANDAAWRPAWSDANDVGGSIRLPEAKSGLATGKGKGNAKGESEGEGEDSDSDSDPAGRGAGRKQREVWESPDARESRGEGERPASGAAAPVGALEPARRIGTVGGRDPRLGDRRRRAREACERALAWLAERQRPDGLFSDVESTTLEEREALSALILFLLSDDARFRETVRLHPLLDHFERRRGRLRGAVEQLWLMSRVDAHTPTARTPSPEAHEALTDRPAVAPTGSAASAFSGRDRKRRAGDAGDRRRPGRAYHLASETALTRHCAPLEGSATVRHSAKRGMSEKRKALTPAG